MEKLQELIEKLETSIESSKKRINHPEVDQQTKNISLILINQDENLKKMAEESLLEFNKYKAKADKWDKLDEKIAYYYPETTDDTEEDEYDDGLLGIGEAAAQAFGYL